MASRGAGEGDGGTGVLAGHVTAGLRQTSSSQINRLARTGSASTVTAYFQRKGALKSKISSPRVTVNDHLGYYGNRFS